MKEKLDKIDKLLKTLKSINIAIEYLNKDELFLMYSYTYKIALDLDLCEPPIKSILLDILNKRIEEINSELRTLIK